jgi:hypothetical protein
MYTNLAILAAFAFLYSAFAKGIERTWVDGTIIFTTFGLLLGSKVIATVAAAETDISPCSTFSCSSGVPSLSCPAEANLVPSLQPSPASVR